MKSDIEVLHKIFEHELKPPFTFESRSQCPFVFDKSNDTIGVYSIPDRSLYFNPVRGASIISKVGQFFIIDDRSYHEMEILCKHLLGWLIQNLSKPIESVAMPDIHMEYSWITYHKKV